MCVEPDTELLLNSINIPYSGLSCTDRNVTNRSFKLLRNFKKDRKLLCLKKQESAAASELFILHGAVHDKTCALWGTRNVQQRD